MFFAVKVALFTLYLALFTLYLALFTLYSIHTSKNAQKQKLRNNKMKGKIRFKAQTGQKTEISSWYIKKFEEKKRRSIEETDWYII